MTTYYKRIFPAIWFGFLAVMTITTLLGASAKGAVGFVAFPVIMAIFGYFIMMKLVFDLADEVYDAGEFLVVKNRGREQEIPIGDIINVSVSNQNPTRITLRLTGSSSATSLGSEIAFTPQQRFTLNPFAKNDIAEDLIVRVDKARARRAA